MAAPSAVLDELSTHLQKVDEDPTTQLDTELLERCELYTSLPEYRNHVWKESRPLFLQIANLLPKLQQDPSLLTRVITKLSQPYRFEDIKDVEFEAGLDLKATPFHSLILTLLEKATTSAAGAQALANKPQAVASVVRLWLCTEDTGVATQAENLLTALLRVSTNDPVSVDIDAPLHTYGNGPMWRRLFHDRDIYALYYRLTSLKKLSSSAESLRNERETSISQARLLSWLPTVGATNFATVATSQNHDIEREVGLKDDQGLLHYASLHMVDSEHDVLMYTTLINFYSTLITTVRTKPHLTPYDSSLSLDFLQHTGIHAHLISSYTSDNNLLSFISTRTARYISDYATAYPLNFARSPSMPLIRDFVYSRIRRCEANDLNIIASMPRATLIPKHTNSGAYVWDQAIILATPVTRTNPDALKTLATIFHGPIPAELTFPAVPTPADQAQEKEEAVFARLLTMLFIAHKPSLFADLVTHIETLAMADNALAALALVRGLVTARWSAESLPDIPSTDSVYARLATFPATGLDLLLSASITGSLLPTLLKPATAFSNLIGGSGDAENVAFRVASARFDLLNVIARALEEGGGREDVLVLIKRRVGEGVWGSSGEVGSRIGTLEL